MAPTTYIVDKDGNQIDASKATVPSDRHFRGAWSLSGKVISEDMAKAKEIFKDKIREVRKPLLEAEDVVYMKALEADDADAKAASVTKKNCVMHPGICNQKKKKGLGKKGLGGPNQKNRGKKKGGGGFGFFPPKKIF
ncbi:MAG: hypothetical protein CM15mV148_090 [uncultured marine virus]|nr:MAG: hypothetical protein CM15mV148_090 [uncultured marine virus]